MPPGICSHPGALKRNICHRPFIKPYQGWENNEPNASQWEKFKVHHLFLNTAFLLFLDYQKIHKCTL